MGKYLWLAVTADEYELPLVVADSAKELGAKFGVKDNTVVSAITRGYNGRENGFKYVRVEKDYEVPIQEDSRESRG